MISPLDRLAASPFAWSIVYLLVHLLLYFAVLRTLRAFSREPIIFAYHFLSVLGVALLLLVGLVGGTPGVVDLATLVAIVSLHGIYSISFLELWSLSEGGYSLAIMEYVARHRARGERVGLEGLHRLGQAKQANRLAGIERLGLIRRAGDGVELTSVGRVVAAVLAAIAWAANIRERG